MNSSHHIDNQDKNLKKKPKTGYIFIRLVVTFSPHSRNIKTIFTIFFLSIFGSNTLCLTKHSRADIKISTLRTRTKSYKMQKNSKITNPPTPKKNPRHHKQTNICNVNICVGKCFVFVCLLL